jgi:hypothetical protein
MPRKRKPKIEQICEETKDVKIAALQVSVSLLMMAPDCRTRLLLRLAHMDDVGEPPPGTQISALAGTWGHKAMAAWLSDREWQPEFEPYQAISRDLGIHDDRRGYDNMHKIISEVVHRYPIGQLPFELLSPATTEVSFVAPLGLLSDGTPVHLIGYIDKLVKDKHSGLKLPLEHKFTGRLDGNFVGRFTEYDPQLTAYMWAAETVLGEPIGDAWVNAIEMKMVPTSESKCKKHGVLYEECGPLHVTQTFIQAHRSPQQINEFKRLALAECETYILPVAKALKKKGVNVATQTPREGIITGACEYCEYRRWCLTANRGPSIMATMLKERAMTDDRLHTGLVIV